MLNPNLKEVKVVPNGKQYDIRFYSGRIDETQEDFSEVASKYQNLGISFYQKSNEGSYSKESSIKIPGGLICPKVFVREKSIDGKVELEKVEPSDLRSDDRELVRIVLDELRAKEWKEAK
ncbi:MAG: hypothetical protein WC867_03220 [Candidatus Pacearchaeota archaeon]|jgi:hypothetical protein